MTAEQLIRNRLLVLSEEGKCWHYVEIVKHVESFGIPFTEVNAALDRMVESGKVLQHEGSMYEFKRRTK